MDRPKREHQWNHPDQDEFLSKDDGGPLQTKAIHNEISSCNFYIFSNVSSLFGWKYNTYILITPIFISTYCQNFILLSQLAFLRMKTWTQSLFWLLKIKFSDF